MTKKEMAVNLFSTAAAMESISGPSPLTLSMRAGAEALRAGEWKPIANDLLPLHKLFEFYGSKGCSRWVGYKNEYGEWMIETCTGVTNMYPPTHYRELPAPPEGV